MRGSFGAQSPDVNPGRFADGGAVAQEPDARGVGVDARLARLPPHAVGTLLEDVEHEGVQDLVDHRVHRKQRDLVAVGAVDRDHAELEAPISGGDAAEAVGVVPFERDAVGENEIQDAAFEGGDDGLARERAPDLALGSGGLELHAAAAEVAERLGPDRRPEVAKTVGPRVGVLIGDNAQGDGDGRGGLPGGSDREKGAPRHRPYCSGLYLAGSGMARSSSARKLGNSPSV